MRAETSALYRIYESARLYPERIAYTDDKCTYTYSEFLERCEKIAGSLCNDTAPVICYGERGADMLCSMLGCYIAKRTYVPVEKNTPHERIRSIISKTGARLILDASGECDTFYNVTVRGIAIGDKQLKANFSDFDENRSVYMIFTSGSTGEPKGVPINERNLASFVGWIGNVYSDERYRRINILGTASFSFDLSVADIYLSLCFGNTLVSAPKSDKENSERICSCFERHSISLAVMTPTFARMCLLGGMFREELMPNLRGLFLCGEVLDKKTAKKLLSAFPGLSLFNAYGPTEAACAVSGIDITQAHTESPCPLPVGKIGACACDIEICDGQIVLGGDSVFSGYIGGVSGGHFTENGINRYNTGDLGFISDGLLYCNGRNDGQIKLRGYRIELPEIESVLSKLEGVHACAVVAKRSSDGTVKGIRAYVCPETDSVTEDTLLSELSEILPRYMIPRIIMMSELPINQNGKTDRKKLSEM